MTQQIDTLQKIAPPGARCRSSIMLQVTTFCHSFRHARTLSRGSFPLGKDLSRATPTRHSLLRSPHASEH
jgi:hypothetical protein